MIAFFSEPLLLLWTRDPILASQTAGLLSLLALVQLVSGLMYVPHNLQLAYGWTSLELKIYLVAIALVVPLTFWAAPRYGAIGCSWILLGLGLCQLIIGVKIMFKKILIHESRNWYVNDLLIPLITAALVSGAGRLFFPNSSNYIIQGLFLVCTLTCTVFLSAMSSFYMRQQVIETFKRLKNSEA
jgi:O-antigen/teichoic acid export membrane protein